MFKIKKRDFREPVGDKMAEHQSKFVLPDGQAPAAVISVAITKSGQLFVNWPPNMAQVDVITVLSESIGAVAKTVKQAMIQAQKEMLAKGPEAPLPSKEELFPSRKRETITH